LTAASTGKICPSCKNTIPEDMIFCDHCGAKWVSTAVAKQEATSKPSETKKANDSDWRGGLIIFLGFVVLVILLKSC
jgi:uncharacterized membrane protein YvbJ